MLFATLGITIPGEIEPDIVLKQRLEAREHQGESLSRVGCVLHKFIAAAGPARFRRADERAIRSDVSFHSTVVRPLYPSHSMRMRLLGSMALTVT